jgi:hypothetical protein
MSQVSWPQPSENENNRRSSSRDNLDKSRYEGFEGMNFEQHRQPFKPQTANNSGKNKPSRREGKDSNKS